MHHALDARLPGRVEEGFRVLDGVGMGERFVIEADPVGVVEDRDALERGAELAGIVEMEGLIENSWERAMISCGGPVQPASDAPFTAPLELI